MAGGAQDINVVNEQLKEMFEKLSLSGVEAMPGQQIAIDKNQVCKIGAFPV